MLNGMSEETLEIMARAGKRDLRAGMVQETWLEHTMAKTKHGKGVVNITEKPRFFIGDEDRYATWILRADYDHGRFLFQHV